MKRNNYILQILVCCFLTGAVIVFTNSNSQAQPANDMCASATALACGGSLVGEDTTGSTDQSADTGCGMGTGTWYTFMGTGDNITIDITNDAFDVEVAIASGACGGLTNISCTDGGTTAESATFTSVAGTTYYIYIGDWSTGGTDAGTFDLAVTCVPPPMPPPNDDCANATSLTAEPAACTGTTAGTTSGSTESLPGCLGTANDDVWYSFVATDTNQDIDITNTGGATTDIVTEVFDGCGGNSLACQDTPNSPVNLTGLTIGNTYYFRVYTWTATATSDTEFTVCVGTPPPPPPGDECADPIPYPGDVAAGTCVTGFDFSIFGDSGNPSPTCDFGGDAVVFFSWTSPIITAAGDPLDLNFDDGDGQANDCDIGIEVYEGGCTTAPVSNCLGNLSGTLTGLTQGTDYILLVYDDSVPDASCDFCLSIACSAPAIAATVTCQPGDEGNFYVEVDVTNFGVGNTAYTVDVGGPQANITATGVNTYGPFPSGTPVDVVLTGVDDATCGATITGLDKDCTCDPLSVEAVADGVVCPGDPFTLDATLNDVIPGGFVDYTVTPGAAGSCTAVPDNPADCVDLALGDDAGSGPIPLGFNFDFFGVTYSSVCVGSNGYVTFTCVDETDLSEDPIPTPGDPDGIIALFWDDLNPTDAISGIICTYPATIGGQTCFVADYQGVAHFGGGETITGQIIICPDNTVTINCIDCQSDGGTDTAGQGIEDETGSTGYFDPAFPGGTVPAAVTTSNCVTFTPNVDPDSACDFVAWVTDINDIAGTTVSTTSPFDVNPTMTTTYYAVVDCDGVPCFDDVVVTMDDPANCAVCQGIDLAAGLPVVPTEVCSGATADICLTLIDAAEGLVVTGTIDGAPVTLTGVAGAGPNELCVTINAPTNETCAPVDVVIQIDAIQCTDGTDYPGILGGATLLDDLTGAGLNPINVPVYPTLSVVTDGDAACGDLTATLEAADGTVCATAAGSPFTCTADGETLDYDFTADVAAFTAVPVDCPLPTLTGTLTCDGCACMSAPSAISTTDPTRICIDGIGDPINVAIDTDGGGVGTWVITDAAGIILALPPGPPFDLDGAGAGQCLIWYVNADDATFMPAVGDDAAAAVAAFGCAFLSNSITVDRIEVTAAAISTTDPLTICVDDGMDEPIDVAIDDAGIGANGAWVITDATGTIVALPAALPFILDGAGVGTCSIWWVNYDDPAFAPAVGDDAAAIVAAATCAALSNSIDVVREICDPCGASPSSISTTDPTRICIDGVGDPINVTIDMDGGATGTWVITDAAGIILALPPGPPFDLDGAGAGQCLIWYVNSNDPAFMPMVGDDAAAAVAASDCAFLSNAITVDRIEVSAATLSSSPTSPITICTDDGMDEPIDVTIDDAGIGAMGAWVITDAAGMILALPAGPPFVLDGAGVGNCLIWWVNYDDPAFAPAVGDDAPAIVAAATCAALSNSIEVIREDNCGTCEDAIAGNINVDEPMCDITGMMVEILDSNDVPVMGSPVMVDPATGDYSLAGPFPCGMYSVQIVAGTAPVCYEQLGGTEGPFEFEVDGDGTADGANFGTTPQIPTLSQWGLITLALLMMCFGAIKIAYRKEKTLTYIK